MGLAVLVLMLFDEDEDDKDDDNSVSRRDFVAVCIVAPDFLLLRMMGTVKNASCLILVRLSLTLIFWLEKENIKHYFCRAKVLLLAT